MSIRADRHYDFQQSDSKHTGSKGESVTVTLEEEKEVKPETIYKGDRAIQEFSVRSLRSITNQSGTNGYTFHLDPNTKAVSSEFSYPETLRKTKHPVQNFWVYDGAQPTIGSTGKIATSRDQILPNKRIREQDAIEWNRVGSKKGWMFNGRPQQDYGTKGEDTPTHTSDGFEESIRRNKWVPFTRSADKQGLATREMPAIDIVNNARGVGTTGEGSGSGGMAGGYREVNPKRLSKLPIPMAKYNWTGNRPSGTAREDQSLQHGAGGFRSGYASKYPMRPSFPERRNRAISRVTQNAV